jgi:hypothetical protein
MTATERLELMTSNMLVTGREGVREVMRMVAKCCKR